MLVCQVQPALRPPLGYWNLWDSPKASREQRAFRVPKDFPASSDFLGPRVLWLLGKKEKRAFLACQGPGEIWD